MVKTASRMCDRPFCSRKVPWGMSGLGVVFILSCAQRPFVSVANFSRRSFALAPVQTGSCCIRRGLLVHRKPRLAIYLPTGERLRPGACSFETDQSLSKRVTATRHRQEPHPARHSVLLL